MTFRLEIADSTPDRRPVGDLGWRESGYEDVCSHGRRWNVIEQRPAAYVPSAIKPAQGYDVFYPPRDPGHRPPADKVGFISLFSCPCKRLGLT